MAILQSGPINSGAYERSTPEGTPLPPGLYRGVIVKSDQRKTGGGTTGRPEGIMLNVEFDITWPDEYSNRKFWDSFNLQNANADTVRIAKEALADLIAAAYNKGYEMNDDDELLGQEVLMELRIKPANKDKNGKEWPAKNVCGKYWHIDTNVEEAKKQRKEEQRTKKTAQPGQSAQPSQPASSGAAQAPKWGAQKSSAPQQQAPAQPQPAAPAPAPQTAPQTAAATAAPRAGGAPWARTPKQ